MIIFKQNYLTHQWDSSRYYPAGKSEALLLKFMHLIKIIFSFLNKYRKPHGINSKTMDQLIGLIGRVFANDPGD